VRDRIAFAVLLFALLAVVAGFYISTGDLPAEDAPDATFEVEADLGAGELAVEHAGGESLPSGSIRVLVYEDRPLVPDRTVHGTIWETDTELIQPGNRIELEDPRFDAGQRVVVRWFGDDGQANLHETSV